MFETIRLKYAMGKVYDDAISLQYQYGECRKKKLWFYHDFCKGRDDSENIRTTIAKQILLLSTAVRLLHTASRSDESIRYFYDLESNLVRITAILNNQLSIIEQKNIDIGLFKESLRQEKTLLDTMMQLMHSDSNELAATYAKASAQVANVTRLATMAAQTLLLTSLYIILSGERDWSDWHTLTSAVNKGHQTREYLKVMLPALRQLHYVLSRV